MRNSVPEKIGGAAALMNAVKETARERQCKRIWLIITDDNHHAIGFYHKPGYELIAKHRGVLEIYRLL